MAKKNKYVKGSVSENIIQELRSFPEFRKGMRNEKKFLSEYGYTNEIMESGSIKNYIKKQYDMKNITYVSEKDYKLNLAANGYSETSQKRMIRDRHWRDVAMSTAPIDGSLTYYEMAKANLYKKSLIKSLETKYAKDDWRNELLLNIKNLTPKEWYNINDPLYGEDRDGGYAPAPAFDASRYSELGMDESAFGGDSDAMDAYFNEWMYAFMVIGKDWIHTDRNKIISDRKKRWEKQYKNHKSKDISKEDYISYREGLLNTQLSMSTNKFTDSLLSNLEKMPNKLRNDIKFGNNEISIKGEKFDISNTNGQKKALWALYDFKIENNAVTLIPGKRNPGNIKEYANGIYGQYMNYKKRNK